MTPPNAPETPLVGSLTESIAPVPTPQTLRRRTRLGYQAYRFLRITLRMGRMVLRSHQR